MGAVLEMTAAVPSKCQLETLIAETETRLGPLKPRAIFVQF